MLSLTSTYARLDIEKTLPFGEVTESLRSLFQICRLNDFRAALIVSDQDAYDCRSSLRIALKFTASRGAIPPIRLAMVIANGDFGVRKDIQDVATDVGLECKTFAKEKDGVSWLLPAASSRK
jgi:hypothetical protein